MAEDMRSRRTERHLMEAFGEAIADKPLNKITVKSLAEAAEVSKQTFYLHYTDIYDLAEKWAQRQIADMVDGMDFIEELFADSHTFVRRLYDTMAANGNLGAILFRNDLRQVFLPSFLDRMSARITEVWKPRVGELEVSVATTMILSGILALPSRHGDNMDAAIEAADNVLVRIAAGFIRTRPDGVD